MGEAAAWVILTNPRLLLRGEGSREMQTLMECVGAHTRANLRSCAHFYGHRRCTVGLRGSVIPNLCPNGPSFWGVKMPAPPLRLPSPAGPRRPPPLRGAQAQPHAAPAPGDLTTPPAQRGFTQRSRRPNWLALLPSEDSPSLPAGHEQTLLLTP